MEKFCISFGKFVFNSKSQDMDYVMEKTICKKYKNLNDLLKNEKFKGYVFHRDDLENFYELINIKNENKRIIISQEDF